MKKVWLKFATAVVALGFAATVQAVPITGSIAFDGGATLNGSLATATQVNTWIDVEVTSVDGSFAGFASPGDAAAFADPWVFNSGLAGLWSVGGFTFDLTTSSVVLQSSSFLIVEGLGTISGNSFDPTPGIWRFSTQSPSAAGVFSFSASTDAVPEGGATIVLFGAALSGLGLLRRKMIA